MKTNKIYHSKAEDFLKNLPGELIDLTVTSPPYDKLRSYNNEFDLKIIIPELFRATKPGGICVWVVADQTKNFSESGTSFRQALAFMEFGWCLFDTMIWKKKNPMPGHRERYTDAFEYMFVFSKGKPRVFNPIKISSKTAGMSQKWAERPHESKVWKKKGPQIRRTNKMKIKSNVWEFATGKGGSTNDIIAFEHPAIFPEKLVADHISSWTNEGDLVADIFSGSGTTAKVAHLMNRKWIGSEHCKNNCGIAERRMEPYLNNLFTPVNP